MSHHSSTSEQQTNEIENLKAFITKADEMRSSEPQLASETLSRVIEKIQYDKPYAKLAEQILASDVPLDQTQKSEISPSHLKRFRLHARACSLYATIYSDQNRLEEALIQIKNSQILSQAAGEEEDYKTFVFLADIHRKQGKYKQAMEEFETSLDLLKERGDERTSAFILDNWAHAFAAQGNLLQARDYRLKAIEIMEGLSETIPTAIFRGNLAKDYYRLGELAQAEKEVRKALPILEKGDSRCESYTYRVFGDILIAQNKIPEAKDAYHKAAESHNPHCHVMAEVGLGWWELRFGSSKAATKAFAVSQDPQKLQEDEALHTEAAAGLALAKWDQGKQEEALDIIGDALKRDITTVNLYVKGFVLAAYTVLLRVQDNRRPEAIIAASSSDESFEKAARPLVGLSDQLFLRYQKG